MSNCWAFVSISTLSLITALPPLVGIPQVSSHQSADSSPPPAPSPAAHEIDLSQILTGYDGAFVLRSLTTGETWRHNPHRCAVGFSPCSTFKIPNSIIGLDTGVLRDADHPYRWDGTPGSRPELNRDQTLRSALRDSVVWYYQREACEVGAERMQQYLDRFNYGNHDISGGLTNFWLMSSLQISADEQVDFLTRLARGGLPAGARAQELVRELLTHYCENGITLRGKTGSGAKGDDNILGWFVGTLTRPDDTYVFALNISADRDASGRKARELVYRILHGRGLMPAVKP